MFAMIGFQVKSFFQRLRDKEDGQAMVEYGIIIGLIAVAVIAVIALLGKDIAAFFTNVRSGLSSGE